MSRLTLQDVDSGAASTIICISGHHIPSPNARTSIQSLPPEVLMLIFNLLSRTNRRPLPVSHFTRHLPRHIPSLASFPSIPAPNGITLAQIAPNPPQQPATSLTPLLLAHQATVASHCDCKYLFLSPAFHYRLFPYNLSAVCIQWRNILGSSPSFWNRIVVSRVAGSWADPAEFQWYLERSKNLVGIEVYIGSELTNHTETLGYSELTESSEREMVARYTEALKSHLWRCSVIDYNVKYSTSLPSIVDDLRGISSNLVSLRLVCSEEGHLSDAPSTSSTDPTRIPFPTLYPDLKDVSLDGYNFIQTTLHHPQLLRSVQDKLTVHHYHYNNDTQRPREPFTAHNVLEGIFPRSPLQLLTLHFNSIEFSPIEQPRYIIKSPSPTPELLPVLYHVHPPLVCMISDSNVGTIDWSNVFLKCSNMSDQLLNDLIAVGISGNRCPQTVELDNCVVRELDSIAALRIAEQVPLNIPTDRLESSPFTPSSLSFDSASNVIEDSQILHIPEATFSNLPFLVQNMTIRNFKDSQSIVNLITRLEGTDLSIHSCPGFTDNVVSTLELSWKEAIAHYQMLYTDVHPGGPSEGLDINAPYHDIILTLGIDDITITDCANITPGALLNFLHILVEPLTAAENELTMHGLDGTLHMMYPGELWVDHPRCDISNRDEWERMFVPEFCESFVWKYTPRALTDVENAYAWDETKAVL
ncbi:hypothetical protein CVT24_006677 [Panaeolus cyanescens]|uniref:Uncharacterized protein n=1 Tax=Panaeolus cyanescens TaxID=181874 RepID=A0A409YRV4_9AGAR|nr:hypothetical protein CVT24_006677 [Panaeolus cyanescens]